MGRVLVATLGFSMDFVLKRVYDKDLPRVGEAVILALWTDDGSWSRIMEAYRLLEMTLEKVGIRVELERVEYGGGLVRGVRRILRRVALERPGTEVELFLTGGPRMLVVATLLAAASLEEKLAKRFSVTAYGENFPGTLSIGLYHVLALGRLDEKSESILHAIVSGVVEARKLIVELGLPKSTLYMKLSELERHGLIVREGRGRYRLQEELEEII